jgi:2-amino-4-hydroxy-6-hydroxymethyldihydropteridine diphosphokinase
VTSVLSLGSNLGDRWVNLRVGIEVVATMLPVRAVSPVYETEPVGVVDQSAYLNVVALVDSDDAEQVFTAAQAAEAVRGRARTARWGPRTLDVDVIAVDGTVSTDPRLTLPHPRAHERAFVLLPWLDVDPDSELPGIGPVRMVLRGVDRGGVRRWRP